jgi:hypothetical protein
MPVERLAWRMTAVTEGSFRIGECSPANARSRGMAIKSTRSALLTAILHKKRLSNDDTAVDSPPLRAQP